MGTEYYNVYSRHNATIPNAYILLTDTRNELYREGSEIYNTRTMHVSVLITQSNITLLKVLVHTWLIDVVAAFKGPKPP